MKLKNVKVGMRVVVKDGVCTDWYTAGNVGTVLTVCEDGTVEVDFDNLKELPILGGWWVSPKQIKPFKQPTKEGEEVQECSVGCDESGCGEVGCGEAYCGEVNNNDTDIGDAVQIQLIIEQTPLDQEIDQLMYELWQLHQLQLLLQHQQQYNELMRLFEMETKPSRLS